MSRQKVTVWFGVMVVALLLTMLTALSVGTDWISPSRLIQAVLQTPDQTVATTLWSIRLPRMISSLMAGGMLAVAGALFQAVLRNPIADPSILGVSAAANFFVLIGGMLLPALFLHQLLFAFLGGCSVLWLLTSPRALRHPYQLIIMGVAIDATFVGLTQVMSQGTISQFASNFNGQTWPDTITLLVIGTIGLAAAIVVAPWANYLKLDDQALLQVGVSVRLLRWGLLLLAMYLATGVTAVVGAIPFVGIVVPNLARRLVGHDYAVLLPFSMLFGAWLMLGSDTIGRTVIAPSEISAATMMAVVGGPFLVLLLRQGRPLDGIATR